MKNRLRHSVTIQVSKIGRRPDNLVLAEVITRHVELRLAHKLALLKFVMIDDAFHPHLHGRRNGTDLDIPPSLHTCAVQFFDVHLEVVLQLLVENLPVLLREINVSRLLLDTDRPKAPHGRLQDEDLRIRVAMHGHGKERTAVPALASLVDEQDKLLFRLCRIQIAELAQIVIRRTFIADIAQDLVRWDAEFDQYILDNGTYLAIQVVDLRRKDRHLRQHSLEPLLSASRLFPEVTNRFAQELPLLRIGIARDDSLLQILVIDCVLQRIRVDDLGQQHIVHERRTRVVEARHHARPGGLQVFRQLIDRASERRRLLIREVTLQLCAEHMMRLVHVNAEIREPLQHLESLVADKLSLILGLGVEVQEVGERIPLLCPHLLGDGLVLVLDLEKPIRDGLVLVRLLEDDLLVVRNDDIELRSGRNRQRHRTVVKIVILDGAGEFAHIVRRDDLRYVERLNLLQRLQDRLVGREHEDVVAVLRILRILPRQDELVEDARRHERRLAETHRERVDVVRVQIAPRRHAIEGRLERRRIQLGPKRQVVIPELHILAIRKDARSRLPVLEDVGEACVSAVLLQEDIHLQRLELRLAQIARLALFVLSRIVRLEKLARQRLILRPDRLLVRRIELPQVVVERRELNRALLLPRHYETSCSSDSDRRSVILTRIVPASSGMSYSPFTNSSFSGMSVTVGVKTEPS